MRLLVALLAVSLSFCTLGQAKLAAYAGVTADLATTQAAINSGLREANPLIAATGEPVAFSAFVSTCLLGGAAWAEQHDPDGALWFYRWIGLARGAMAVNNAVKIISNHQKKSSKAAPVVGVAVRF